MCAPACAAAPLAPRRLARDSDAGRSPTHCGLVSALHFVISLPNVIPGVLVRSVEGGYAKMWKDLRVGPPAGWHSNLTRSTCTPRSAVLFSKKNLSGNRGSEVPDVVQIKTCYYLCSVHWKAGHNLQRLVEWPREKCKKDPCLPCKQKKAKCSDYRPCIRCLNSVGGAICEDFTRAVPPRNHFIISSKLSPNEWRHLSIALCLNAFCNEISIFAIYLELLTCDNSSG